MKSAKPLSKQYQSDGGGTNKRENPEENFGEAANVI